MPAMMNLARSEWVPYFRARAGWTRTIAFIFLYWLAFLLVLEPGNLYRASQAGHLPTLPHEVVRIAVAAMLGTAFSFIPMFLTRNFPIIGARWPHRIWIHALGATLLAFVLILMSCLLAAWIFEGKWFPSLLAIRAQLVNNWLLLIYALLALTAIAHVMHLIRSRETSEQSADEGNFLTRVAVKMRGKTRLLDVADIEWIETQGNYLALHTGSETHLIRETLTQLETKLDPMRFVRIHRRVIVAIDRILAVETIENGDAILHLDNSRELRVSRRYRDEVRRRWNRPA
jgi:hypothetical protein